LLRKKESWLLPGGKPKLNESDIACLVREVEEELSGTELENIAYYGEFIGKTHIGEEFKTKVYLANVKGELKESSAEISEYKWAR